jgi:hypothetical protein
MRNVELEMMKMDQAPSIQIPQFHISHYQFHIV